jgi:hypothetical protein
LLCWEILVDDLKRLWRSLKRKWLWNFTLNRLLPRLF